MFRQPTRARAHLVGALSPPSHLQRRLSTLHSSTLSRVKRRPRRVHRSTHAHSDFLLRLRRPREIILHRARRSFADAEVKQIIRVSRFILPHLAHVHATLRALAVGLGRQSELSTLGVHDGAEVIIDVGREDEFGLLRVGAKRLERVENVDARELADGSDEGGRASTARSVDGGTAAAAAAAAASTTASTHG